MGSLSRAHFYIIILTKSFKSEKYPNSYHCLLHSQIARLDKSPCPVYTKKRCNFRAEETTVTVGEIFSPEGYDSNSDTIFVISEIRRFWIWYRKLFCCSLARVATCGRAKMNNFFRADFGKSALWRRRVNGSGQNKLYREVECPYYC